MYIYVCVYLRCLNIKHRLASMWQFRFSFSAAIVWLVYWTVLKKINWRKSLQHWTDHSHKVKQTWLAPEENYLLKWTKGETDGRQTRYDTSWRKRTLCNWFRPPSKKNRHLFFYHASHALDSGPNSEVECYIWKAC